MKEVLPPSNEQMQTLLGVAERVSGLPCQIGG